MSKLLRIVNSFHVVSLFKRMVVLVLSGNNAEIVNFTKLEIANNNSLIYLATTEIFDLSTTTNHTFCKD